MGRLWAREIAGWGAALALSVVVAAQVASTARSELLFRDGDSLVVAMLTQSVLSGEHLDWALSSVLFVPETAGFALVSLAMPVELNVRLAIAAVANLLAVYGALRLAAGRHREGASPVAWSLLAFAAFGALATTETSGSRDALELASLPLTTTYYSATVVGVLLAVGVARRHLDSPRRAWPVTLGILAALSCFSNPLFAAWATVPLLLVLLWIARHPPRTAALTLSGVLLGGTALGAIARIPAAEWIANTGAGYAQPDRWMESLVYYGGLLGDRLASPLGLLAGFTVVAMLALAVVRSRRATTAGERLVAMSAWLAPALVAVGAIALGTHAARYLQPLAFAPLLAVVATAPAMRIRRAVLAAASAVVVVAVLLSIPRLDAAVHRPDADLDCVTSWIEDSGRTGAGQFWTARLPKAHLADPARLVQVDHRLNGYAWLVNRTDFAPGAVSFLIEDAQTVPWELPSSAVPERVVPCGRYEIIDFGGATVPIGPAHS